MASVTSAFVFVAITIFTLLPNGNSLECYQCNLEECNKNITLMSKKPCQENNQQCFRLINPKTDAVVQRGCAPEEFCDIFAECDMCTKELCNSSSRNFSFFNFMGVIAMIVVKLCIV
ncbi:hypothetical protein FQR65_LT01821 [Abscondita terminalis]|nr:hypothetical protein FQR65_LT01821 [Abscondita terminalis]